MTRLWMILIVGLSTSACGSRAADPVCSFGGATYQPGESFPSSDGCNTCSCDGTGVSCTALSCTGQLPAGSCSYNGKVYKTGDVFPASDGCNSCSCNPEGHVGVGCSARLCPGSRPDSGPVELPPCKEPLPAGSPCSAGLSCWTKRASSASVSLEVCSCQEGRLGCIPIPTHEGAPCSVYGEGTVVGPQWCPSRSSPYVDCSCTCTAGSWRCKPNTRAVDAGPAPVPRDWGLGDWGLGDWGLGNWGLGNG